MTVITLAHAGLLPANQTNYALIIWAQARNSAQVEAILKANGLPLDAPIYSVGADWYYPLPEKKENP